MMMALANREQVLARLKEAADATARGESWSDEVELMQCGAGMKGKRLRRELSRTAKG